MPITRDRVFDRILVDHLVRGGTRVSWKVAAGFKDADPWHFQLQVGATGNNRADDWTDVGAPVENASSAVHPRAEFLATDAQRRLRGVAPTTHYRVRLTTGAGSYVSEPATIEGVLGPRDWLVAREIVRKERLRHGRQASVPGWLLKRKRSGAQQAGPDAEDARRMILDPLTGEVINRQGAVATQGTEYLGGFYKPVEFDVDLATSGSSAVADDQGAGNVDPESLVVSARILLFPMVSSRDIFVARGSDVRYEFQKVKVEAQLRGVPLVGSCELRRIPYSDLLYSLDLDSL